MGKAGALVCLLWVSATPSLLACCTGPDFLTLGFGGTTPRWGERYVATSDFFTAQYDLGKIPGGEPLEFFREGAPVEVPVAVEARDNRPEGGCGDSEVRTYDLSALPSGEYTVVHRRAHGTGDEVNCLECPWESFEGEEALVLTLLIE